MIFAMTTTPENITPLVKQFCQRINPHAEPHFVDVEPEQYGQEHFCNLVVAEKIKRDGGECVSGWIVWLNPDVLIEAEAHMIWRSPEGHDLDVVCKTDGERRILFLESAEPHDFSKNIRSKRQALIDTLYTRALVKYYDRIDQLREKHWKGVWGATIPVNDLMLAEHMRDALLRGDTSPNWYCPCQSNKKYRECCGRPEGEAEPYTNF